MPERLAGERAQPRARRRLLAARPRLGSASRSPTQAAFDARVSAVAARLPRAPTPPRSSPRRRTRSAAIDNSCASRDRLHVRRRARRTTGRRRSPPSAPRGVPATFFNLAVRMQANPQIDRFTLAEGHKILLHSYEHPRLTNLSAERAALPGRGRRRAVRRQRRAAHAQGPARALRRHERRASTRRSRRWASRWTARARPGTLGLRPGPHGARRSATRWSPRCAPAAGLVLHDGPIDTPAGQATCRRRSPMIIDEAAGARLLLRHARRDRPRRRRPLRRLAGSRSRRSPTRSPTSRSRYAGTPPSPWFIVPQPLRIAAAHAPAVFLRGGDRHAHADRLQPDHGHADRRQPDRGHARDPGRADRRRARPATAGPARARRPSPARAARSSRPARRCRRSRSPSNVAADRARGHHHRAARDRPRRQRVGARDERHASARRRPCPARSAGPCPRRSSLTLGAPGELRRRSPRASRASTRPRQTATVTSTAGDATLTVADPSPVATGHLVNGAFALASPLTPLGVGADLRRAGL